MPDVPQRQAAQQGVTKCVDGHIPVRMGYEARGGGYLNAAQPHGKVRGQGVYVVSVSYSDIHITFG